MSPNEAFPGGGGSGINKIPFMAKRQEEKQKHNQSNFFQKQRARRE